MPYFQVGKESEKDEDGRRREKGVKVCWLFTRIIPAWFCRGPTAPWTTELFRQDFELFGVETTRSARGQPGAEAQKQKGDSAGPGYLPSLISSCIPYAGAPLVGCCPATAHGVLQLG
jgi:hypothetical protein